MSLQVPPVQSFQRSLDDDFDLNVKNVGKFAVSVFVNRTREDTATQHRRHGSRNYR